MIEMNVGGIIVETVIEKLWDQYLEDKWSAEAPDDDVEKKLLGKDTPDGKGRKAVKWGWEAAEKIHTGKRV